MGVSSCACFLSETRAAPANGRQVARPFVGFCSLMCRKGRGKGTACPENQGLCMKNYGP